MRVLVACVCVAMRGWCQLVCPVWGPLGPKELKPQFRRNHFRSTKRVYGHKSGRPSRTGAGEPTVQGRERTAVEEAVARGSAHEAASLEGGALATKFAWQAGAACCSGQPPRGHARETAVSARNDARHYQAPQFNPVRLAQCPAEEGADGGRQGATATEEAAAATAGSTRWAWGGFTRGGRCAFTQQRGLRVLLRRLL